MHINIRRIAAASPAFVLALTGCLPYTVGSTARTVAAHETTRSSSYYFIPNAVKLPEDSVAGPLAGADYEFRHGLDAWSDFGFRVMPGGVAVDYKHRLDTDNTGTRTAVSYMVGGGIVNGGEHAMIMATLMASGREDVSLVPYGGLRAIHVMPISAGAVTDKPTVGAFGGLQIGDDQFMIRPELGVYYDHSALGLRHGDLIFVPAITLTRGRRRDSYREDAQRLPVADPSRPIDPRRPPHPFNPRQP